jgi:hypothetical protein
VAAVTCLTSTQEIFKVNRTALIPALFALSPDIRYVATYAGGQLDSSVRDGLSNTSSSESDKYEELIVNPTLLKLVTQRGNIDCGGAEYVLIRYGSFFEFVAPAEGGHISVGIEPHADPLALVQAIREAVALYSA